MEIEGNSSYRKRVTKLNNIKKQNKKKVDERVLLHKVDSAMSASQNGFCSCKLFIHKKTNNMQIMTKKITIFIYLIFYHREIVKLDQFMTLSLTPFCDAAVAKSTVC
jgi:hypothetical protein